MLIIGSGDGRAAGQGTSPWAWGSVRVWCFTLCMGTCLVCCAGHAATWEHVCCCGLGWLQQQLPWLYTAPLLRCGRGNFQLLVKGFQ